MAVEPERGHVATANADIDLTACDREPIHIPGSIQPYGLLLIADLASRTVTGGAGAIEERLTPSWLGRPLGALLAQSIDEAVAQASAAPQTMVVLAAVPGRREAFDATLHISGGHLLVELEPQSDRPQTAVAILAQLDAIGGSFERAKDLQGLCDRAASGFRELTGFDRVMIYRFLDDGAGVVVGENRDPALSSFLDHHFPASDIPRQARALYIRNRVRVIPDAAYTPAPIRWSNADRRPLDLSDASLRSVSPIHVQYLRNMGITASASVSIVKDGLLWGLVACHHRRPRELSYEIRTACRALAGGLARQIRAKEEAELYRERTRLRHAEDALVAQFDSDTPVDRFLASQAGALRTLLDADGFAAIHSGRIHTAGKVPAAADLTALAAWLGPHIAVEPFATSALSERLQAAEAYREQVSGVLAISVSGDVPILLIWFRAETLETLQWAGNPHKGDPSHPDAILTPRASFAAWRETVRGQARRWTIGEVEAAGRLRRALFDLHQSRRLRELNRELGIAVAEKEGLVAEKDNLLREVSHRVQNSLQLVQAFLALQAREEPPEVAGHLVEAQRRLAAVALVHRRLYQADRVDIIDLGRYLDDLTGEMRQSMGGEWEAAITADLAPIQITADRAVNIGLVLIELVINAQKYAYGGQPGPIAITLEPYRGQLRLIVADRGKGQQREGEGFGTRMIRAMVDRLGGTIGRFDNRPGLRVILMAPSDASAPPQS